MKSRVKCQYKEVCCNCNQNKCRSCALRFAPYDQKIAMQIEKDSRKSKYKYDTDDDLAGLKTEILNKKAMKGQ